MENMFTLEGLWLLSPIKEEDNQKICGPFEIAKEI